MQTGVVVRYEDAAARFERDRKVFGLRLEGLSQRAIAEQLEIGIDDVQSSLTRMFGGVTPELRARAIEEEVARCDAMYQKFYLRAIGGEGEAALIALKIMERRARLLGLDRPAADGSALNEAMRGSQQSSSDRINAALDRIVGKATVIEGKATPVPDPRTQEETDGETIEQEAQQAPQESVRPAGE